MKKNKVENTVKIIPSLISNIVDYFKETISAENQKNLLENSSGTIGLLINFFGKPFIDKHFEKVSANKLKDYGFITYTKAAFKQAGESLQSIEVSDGSPSMDIPALLVEKNFFQKIEDYKKELSVLVFQPKYHPAILLVKNSIIEMLTIAGIDHEGIKKFQKEFNEGIENAVSDEFGDDYGKHNEEIKKFLFLENETELLLDIIEQNKIGFTENEDLKYEQAFGAWTPFSERGFGNEKSVDKIIEFEKKLVKVDKLIDDYFSVDPTNHLEKLLFIVADFGKGKSVFLKQYAAGLALNYLESGEGYFPVYFNLRNFSNYNSDTQLGVIEEFLQTRYAIKINSDHFKNRNYFFLIDSLDESCDLSKTALEKVISSIKRIQNIDKTIYRTNRILITSRPFDESLFSIINGSKPFILKKDDRDIPHYVSLYGFKKDQFNDWIYYSLSRIIDDLNFENADQTIKQILSEIKSKRKVDVYSLLIENGTLTSSELRRPIFAYMVYRLLQNSINITSVGKVGIYLSFLNLLSKEAKYIHDPSFKIKIQEQFEARNILHQIAALWTFERQQGRQGLLKKADICRLIGGYGNDIPDDEVIEKHRKTGSSDIQFLSHSYFGENDNMLHFQHQSFAEILLAEYYIKVLIKCALDRTLNIEFLVSKLKIGIPTPQTIEFFREILKLLRDCSSEIVTSDVLEKRNLLIPLLASISIVTNNKSLHSDQLFFQWYDKAGIDRHTIEVPNSLCTNWCINKDLLNRITDLCESVILNDKVFVLSKSSPITSLIDNEVTYLANKNYALTINLEKELALIAGNALFNDNDVFFIRKFDTKLSYSLVKDMTSGWMSDEFVGISIDTPNRAIIELSLLGYDLSNSVFRNCILFDSGFYRSSFKNAKFENVVLAHTRLDEVQMDETSFGPFVDFTGAFFGDEIQLPNDLIQKIRENMTNSESGDIPRFWSHGTNATKFMKYSIDIKDEETLSYIFDSLEFYLKYCIRMKYLAKEDLIRSFETNDKGLNKKILERIESFTDENGIVKMIT